jgi:uncharacterized protein
MASTNQSPQYQAAEQKYLNASTDQERQYWLEEMIRECPKHKSAEKMLSQLKIRLKKLKEKMSVSKKKKGGNKESIKKGEMQAVIIGLTNSGKSSILKSLTNATPKIDNNIFTTINPEIGTLIFNEVQIQIIDEPAIESKNFDIGLIHTADTLLITVTDLKDIQEINNLIENKTHAKKIIIFNKIDLLDENLKRKTSETLKSKKYDFILTSTYNQEGIQELKEKIFESFGMIRIYLKEPGKQPSNKPLIMHPNSTIQQVAKKISGHFLGTIKEIHIWGPSSKFPNQKVGINHKIKDKDIVEFKTR